MPQPNLTDEEAAAAFVLAVGELQAIKTEEMEGDAPDMTEVAVLYGLAKATNPDPDNNPVPPWEELPPLPEEEEPDIPV